MTSLIYLVALALLGQARSEVVELNCSDNATCIDNMAREFVRSMRHQKAVKIFDLFTIEPVESRQARSIQDPITRFMTTHAFSFDWNDFTFRFSNPEGRSDAMDLEVLESRSAKDVSDTVPKKSKSKDEEEVIDDKSGNAHINAHIKPIKRRGSKRKVMQAIVPMLIGMKSAGIAVFGLFMVSIITIKAFLASKMALMVTIGMAVKKLYESYGNGAGLQNHPYLYSQYPIDFPSATSHAYSVNGVSPQFASPELYSPTALGSHSQQHELIQQSDASAQQSQQAPTQLLVNSTRAAERWDGKSKLFKIFEPVVDKIRSFVDPIANVFYDAMPTFRGLNSDVSTAKSVEPDEEKKRPREILIPQPRNIAQRKMSYRKTPRHRPKKYVELNLNLDRLKNNKDYLEYIKTKKYQYNYPHTFYYPRVKYFVNPNIFSAGSNNNRLLSYRKPILRRNIFVNNNNTSETTTAGVLSLEPTDWKPIVVYNVTNSNTHRNKVRKHRKKTQNMRKLRRKKIMKKHKRVERSLDSYESNNVNSISEYNYDRNLSNIAVTSGRGLSGFFQYISNPFTNVLKNVDGYAEKVVQDSLKSKEPPIFYTIAYNIVMFYLDAIDGLVEVHEALRNYITEDFPTKPKRKIKIKNKNKIKNKIKNKNKKKKVSQSKVQSNETTAAE
ncbi:uncharacterized protein LOC112053142 isoform X1 [Bicyclus anynana]|uniref:Uncharacterized protein LOC112053142 isoform X1 n=1 Tax=Bicyclus anynana TaxID=110368 RepID=A0ABM3M0V9_BICAN|nr:uncharacterized protein LOC112053142 isoform X1 [Bicyclus anynana]